MTTGTIRAVRRPGGYEVQLKRGNGRTIASTKIYKTRTEAAHAVQAICEICRDPEIIVTNIDGETEDFNI